MGDNYEAFSVTKPKPKKAPGSPPAGGNKPDDYLIMSVVTKPKETEKKEKDIEKPKEKEIEKPKDQSREESPDKEEKSTAQPGSAKSSPKRKGCCCCS